MKGSFDQRLAFSPDEVNCGWTLFCAHKSWATHALLSHTSHKGPNLLSFPDTGESETARLQVDSLSCMLTNPAAWLHGPFFSFPNL